MLPLPLPPPQRARAAERRPVLAPAGLRGRPAPPVPAPLRARPAPPPFALALPPPQYRGGGAQGPAYYRSRATARPGQLG